MYICVKFNCCRQTYGILCENSVSTDRMHAELMPVLDYRVQVSIKVKVKKCVLR